MLKKILCECGHYDYKRVVDKIDQKTYCKECWRNLMESSGKVEIGCISPETAVCPDRIPAIIGMNANPKKKLSMLENARCYLGHEPCVSKKKEANDLLNVVRQVINDEPTLCPQEGCSHNLSVIRTEMAVTSVCPVHGIIFRVLVRQKE